MKDDNCLIQQVQQAIRMFSFPHGGVLGDDWTLRWSAGEGAESAGVCRGSTCAQARASVALEEDLFALRQQWLDMMGNTASDNSPMEWHSWSLAGA